MRREPTRLLFPVHLFHDALDKNDGAVLVEDPGFFRGCTGDFKLHKGRLAWMRAACTRFCAERGARHVPLEDAETFLRDAAADPASSFVAWDPLDNYVRRRWQEALGDRISIEYSSPGFVIRQPDFAPVVMKRVLEHCQRATGLLVGQPSTDADNRRRPDDAFRAAVAASRARREKPRAAAGALGAAMAWAEKTFPDNPGDVNAARLFPHTRRQALAALRAFVEHALPLFGPYQDAVLAGEGLMLHSGLSAAMNAGLLHPEECARAAVDALGAAPMQSVEAYVRQLLGWREYTRLLYARHGEELERGPFADYARLGAGWYDPHGSLLPLASAVRAAHRRGFLDHIQRLMVGNSLGVLTGAPPGGLLRWFSELVAMDAHQWVMVANIAHMSGMRAGGRLLSRRPYVSSSAYLRRMTDHPPGEWEDRWDALYYAFLRRGGPAAAYYAAALRGKRHAEDPERWKQLAQEAAAELAKK